MFVKRFRKCVHLKKYTFFYGRINAKYELLLKISQTFPIIIEIGFRV